MSKIPADRRTVLKITAGSIGAVLVKPAVGESETTTLQRTVSTDEDGHFEVDLPAGSYEATATKDGFETKIQEVTVEEDESESLNFTLLPQGQFTTHTDDNGHFNIDLPAGTYEVTATGDGFEPETETVTVEEGETETLDFTLLPSDPSGPVESALDSYENAAIDLFEREIEAQARLTAGLFDEFGQEFAEQVTGYWGYKSGELDEDAVDEELRAATGPMLDELDEDDILDQSPEEYALPLYLFFDELFGELDESDTHDDIRETTIDFFFGEYPGQSHEFQIDGESVSDVKAELLDELDAQRDEIEDLLDDHDPPESVREEIADELLSAASQTHTEADDLIENAEDEVDELRGDADEDIEYELSMPEAEEPLLPDLEAELDGDGDARPDAILGGAGIVGAGLLAGKLAGKAGLGKWVLGTVSLKGAVATALKLISFSVKFLIKKLVLLAKKLIAKFKAEIKEQVVENVTRWARTMVERHLIIGVGNVQATITDVHVPDITEDDELDKPLIPSYDGSIWDWIVGVLPFLGAPSVGQETGYVTIENTGSRKIVPEIDFDIEGHDDGWAMLPGAGRVDYEDDDGVLDWLEPGDERTYDFTYELPMDPFPQGRADIEVYDFFLTEEEPFDSTQQEFDVADSGGWLSGILSDGIIDETGTILEEYTVGQFMDGSPTEGVGHTGPTSDGPVRSTVSVTYPESHVDLHVYDEDGNHVGYDYDAGEIVTEIPNAEHSGRDLGSDGGEWVHLDEVDGGPYEVELIGPEAGGTGADGPATKNPRDNGTDDRSRSVSTASDGLEYSTTVAEIPEQPADLGLQPKTVLFRGDEGATVTSTVLIKEVGGDNPLTDVSVSASALSHVDEEETIDVAQISVSPQTVAVDPGDSVSVEITIDIPAELPSGVYEGQLTVDGDGELDGTVSIQLEIPGLVPLPGSDHPPKDLNDDGLHEDIDGDGEFDIFDVQALFNGLDSDAVQNHPEAFNFNEDENPEDVTIFDVQGLFNRLAQWEE